MLRMAVAINNPGSGRSTRVDIAPDHGKLPNCGRDAFPRARDFDRPRDHAASDFIGGASVVS